MSRAGASQLDTAVGMQSDDKTLHPPLECHSITSGLNEGTAAVCVAVSDFASIGVKERTRWHLQYLLKPICTREEELHKQRNKANEESAEDDVNGHTIQVVQCNVGKLVIGELALSPFNLNPGSSATFQSPHKLSSSCNASLPHIKRATIASLTDPSGKKAGCSGMMPRASPSSCTGDVNNATFTAPSRAALDILISPLTKVPSRR